jgi:hypothetical protein
LKALDDRDDGRTYKGKDKMGRLIQRKRNIVTGDSNGTEGDAMGEGKRPRKETLHPVTGIRKGTRIEHQGPA